MADKKRNSDTNEYKIFIKLYLANERRIYGFVRALVPNWSDVDDVIQETAAVLWSKFDQFHKGTNFSAWALKIAHFQVLNYYKNQKKDKLYFSDEMLSLLAEKNFKNPNTDERLSILKKCLQKLKAYELSLIQLRYEPDGSTRKVAEQTGKQLHVLYRLYNKIHAKLLFCIRQKLSEVY